MYDFLNYFEVETLAEAKKMLATYEDLKIIAGGTDVLIKIQKDKDFQGSKLLSIRKIKELSNIRMQDDGTVVIGALATFTQTHNDHIIQEKIPIFAEASLSMGGPQIRNIATVGGNICNGVTSADSAPSLFALNAKLKLESAEGTRVIPIEDFYLGPGKVDLRKGEILTEIIISPENYEKFSGCYIKYSMRKTMDIATLGVAVMCKLNTPERFSEVRIGLGVAGPTPLRCKEAEEFASGKKITAEVIEQIGKLAKNSSKARTSWRASKEYREHLIEVLSKRALKEAIYRAGGINVT